MPLRTCFNNLKRNKLLRNKLGAGLEITYGTHSNYRGALSAFAFAECPLQTYIFLKAYPLLTTCAMRKIVVPHEQRAWMPQLGRQLIYAFLLFFVSFALRSKYQKLKCGHELSQEIKPPAFDGSGKLQQFCVSSCILCFQFKSFIIGLLSNLIARLIEDGVFVGNIFNNLLALLCAFNSCIYQSKVCSDTM